MTSSPDAEETLVASPDRRFAHSVAKNIDPEKIRIEPFLYRTKWFDYRFISPAEATNLFADEYRQLYREAWRTHFDRDEALHKQGIASGDVFAARDRRGLAGIWTARQMADAVGVPYKFFIRYGIEYFLSLRKVDHLPRPNQLVNVDIAHEVERKWKESCAAIPTFSRDERYLDVNFRNESAQVDHRAWLLKLIKRQTRSECRHMIRVLCLERGFLPLELVEDRFNEIIAEARAEATPSIAAHELTKLPIRPGCYGTPHAYRPLGDECGACSHRESCAVEVQGVLAELKERWGSDSPLKDHQRILNKQRQRRFRERKKSAEPNSKRQSSKCQPIFPTHSR